MYRTVCAALAAVLLVAGPAESKTAQVPLRHVILAPGIATDVPDGWMACDPVNNKALHNVPVTHAIDSICNSVKARPEHGGKVEVRAFVDSDYKTKMMMGAFFTDSYTIPDEYISGATPQFLGEVEEVFCKNLVGRSGFPLDACSLRPATVGGRPGFIGEAEATSKGGSRFAGRFYIVSSNSGTMAFVFAGAVPFTAHVQAVMAQVAGSMNVEPRQAMPTPEQVSVTPIAGLTMSVPKTWTSCDSTVAAGLSPMVENAELRSSLCPAWLVTDHVTRVLDTHTPHLETVEVSAADGMDSDAMAQHLTSEQIALDHDDDCKSLSESGIKDGYKLVDCQSEIGTFGGHPAKVVTVQLSGRPDPEQFTANLKMRVTYVPVGHRLFMISLMTQSALTPDFDATGGAILSSVAFQ